MANTESGEVSSTEQRKTLYAGHPSNFFPEIRVAGSGTTHIGDNHHSGDVYYIYHCSRPDSQTSSQEHVSDRQTHHQSTNGCEITEPLREAKRVELNTSTNLRCPVELDSGLSRVPDETEETWTSVLNNIPCKAHIRLEDAGPGGALVEKDYPTCTVNIEVTSQDLIVNSKRRLVFHQNKTSDQPDLILWLPSTYVQVARAEHHVTAKFSNCNKMVNRTRDHVNNYEAIYEPSSPNVITEFECADEESAVELHSRILHMSGPWNPYPLSEALLPPFCTIRHARLKMPDGGLRGSLFAWSDMKDENSGEECTVLDLASFTSKLDFEFEVREGTFVLTLRQVMKIKYTPFDVGRNPTWPPVRVRGNVAGEPASIGFGLDPRHDALRIRAPERDALRLLNSSIGPATGFEAIGWFHVIHVKPSSKFRRPKASCQLTVWHQTDHVYCLLRTDSSGIQDDEVAQRWLAWSIIQQDDRHSQQAITFTNSKGAVFENIDVVASELLSLAPQRMLKPRSSNEDIGQTLDDLEKIELRFNTENEMQCFRSLMCHQNIN